MNENMLEGARTVNIPIDEYFELRSKAAVNAMLMQELGELKGRFYDIERRLWFLEEATKGARNNDRT